ncbi:MAG: hypothetical protein H8E20_15435 [Verrucomicrobia bacterium]|nr:hypothetical protein [Verrucomicrobiota bacterium]
MNGNPAQPTRRFRRALGLAAIALGLGQPLGQAAGGDDLVRFLDGSMLHGELQQVRLDTGVRWARTDLTQPVDFRPDNMAWIRFEGARPVERQREPSVHIRFHNGDEVLGNLIALDEQRVRFSTWFNEQLSAPRDGLQSLAFLSPGFRILYEGPTTLDGWKLGRDPKAWKYRDGVFISEGVGVLGRDFGLKGSSRIEFDLQWNGTFSLIVPVYTKTLDRFDYRSNSYMFYISRGYVSLQRVQNGAGVRNLGQGQIPEMQSKNRVQVELRINKEKAEMELYIDRKLVRKWRDTNGFAATGSGMAFFSQLNGPIVRVSNLRVSAWDGQSDPVQLAVNDHAEDMVFLKNRDEVPGKLKSMDGRTVVINSLGTDLAIPLERITRVALTKPEAKPGAKRPWEVRAHFAGGAAVSFDLNQWDGTTLTGRSRNFGPVTFDSKYIRRLQFNLGTSQKTSETNVGAANPLWPWDD